MVEKNCTKYKFSMFPETNSRKVAADPRDRDAAVYFDKGEVCFCFYCEGF